MTTAKRGHTENSQGDIHSIVFFCFVCFCLFKKIDQCLSSITSSQNCVVEYITVGVSVIGKWFKVPGYAFSFVDLFHIHKGNYRYVYNYVNTIAELFFSSDVCLGNGLGLDYVEPSQT